MAHLFYFHVGTDSSPAAAKFTVDRTPPVTSIAYHPPPVSNFPSPVFGFSASEVAPVCLFPCSSFCFFSIINFSCLCAFPILQAGCFFEYLLTGSVALSKWERIGLRSGNQGALLSREAYLNISSANVLRGGFSTSGTVVFHIVASEDNFGVSNFE